IEDCLPPLEDSPAKRFSPSKRKQYYINKAIRNSDLIPKAKGRKSLQRLENTRYLMTLLERDECGNDEGELDHSAAPSIFSEACNNETYVEVGQGRLPGRVPAAPRCVRSSAQLVHAEPNLCRLQHFLQQGPLLHPSVASLCSIDIAISALRPSSSDPPVPLLPRSFERLLLHALCQYMDLVSASSDIEGKRQMKVSNKHRVFLRPELLLSDYLEQMS
ncbi:R3H domain-containing protein 4, partial [Tinamus guttatus]